MSISESDSELPNVKRKRGRPKKTLEERKNKQQIADRFYSFCCEGLFPTEIAHEMGLTMEDINKWSKDKKLHPEFYKAYSKGMLACQAFHERLYREMVSQKKSTAGAAMQQQRDILRVRFKNDWADNKQEIKIESTYDKLSDQEIEEQLLKLINKPQSREVLESILRDTKQVFKVIDGGKDKTGTN